jgi:hypothetical protein
MPEQTLVPSETTLLDVQKLTKTLDSSAILLVSSNDYLIRLDIRPSRGLLCSEHARICRILLDSGVWIPEKVSFTVRDGVMVVLLASFARSNP